VRQYVRAVAGPRYDPSTDLLRVTSDSHKDAASNKRALVESMCRLVDESTALAAKFGPMKVDKVRPAYSH
jgi:hypothetical protein